MTPAGLAAPPERGRHHQGQHPRAHARQTDAPAPSQVARAWRTRGHLLRQRRHGHLHWPWPASLWRTRRGLRARALFPARARPWKRDRPSCHRRSGAVRKASDEAAHGPAPRNR